MNLGNAEKNIFFSTKQNQGNYYYGEFNAEETVGLNNIKMFSDRIPNKSVVLDVGCGFGHLGKYLKQKKCQMYGLDLDKYSVDILKKENIYDNIFCGDVNSIEWIDTFQKSNLQFDFIVFSDILEHLTDPTKVLLLYSNLLKLNGKFLISVPNISHIDIIINLINGRFNYSNIGILDNSHLRFFTKDSFVEWIELINNSYEEYSFECNYIGATFHNNTTLQHIKDNYPELFHILCYSENANALQILFELTKIENGSSTPNLNKLLNNAQFNNTSEILGKALQKVLPKYSSANLVNGERLWYEQYYDKLTDNNKELINNNKELTLTINNLQLQLEDYKKYVDKLETEIHNQCSYIEDCKKYINELEVNSENQSKYIDNYKKYVDKLETDNKDQLQLLTNIKNNILGKIYFKLRD